MSKLESFRSYSNNTNISERMSILSRDDFMFIDYIEYYTYKENPQRACQIFDKDIIYFTMLVICYGEPDNKMSDSHANALIIHNGHLIRYEPHGPKTNIYDQKKLDIFLKDYFKKESDQDLSDLSQNPSRIFDLYYIRPLKYQEEIGPQMFEKTDSDNYSGFCLMWSLYFIYLYQRNIVEYKKYCKRFRIILYLKSIEYNIMENKVSLPDQIRAFTSSFMTDHNMTLRSHKKIKITSKK